MPSLSDLHARYIALAAERDPDDPELMGARREYVFAKLGPGPVAEFVANCPPMTEEQCQRIAAMLKAGRP